jgi:hypothetical protein
MSRFNFVVDDDSALNNLVSLTRRSSKADVVRDALSLYQYLIRRVQRGDRIFIGKDPQTVVELAVTTLQNVAPEQAVTR